MLSTSLTGAISRGMMSISRGFVQQEKSSRNSPDTNTTGRSASAAAAPPDGPAEDLQLLHHYMISTSTLFGKSPETLDFWQKEVVQIGFQYRFVLDLVLALASFHQATLEPSQRDMYLEWGNRRMEAAVRAQTDLLPNLNSENAVAVYLGASFTCFCSFAVGPKPGHFLIFCETGLSEHFIMLRGVRSVIESSRDELTTRRPSLVEFNEKVERALSQDGPAPDFTDTFQKLRDQFIPQRAGSKAAAAVYLSEANELEQRFRLIRQPPPPGESPGVRYAHIMFYWIYRASDEYVALARDKHSVALVILAHFAALMRRHDSFWILRGWPEHVMAGVYRYVPPEDREWLQWPMEQIGWFP